MPRLATRFVVVGSLLLLASRGPALAMTVEEAYRQTQHRHASLDPASSGFSREEGACLSHLFEIIDLAIVEKTQAMTWFQTEGRSGRPVPEYRTRVDSLVAILDRLPAPARLRDVQRLLIEAIREQEAFFETWNESLTVAASGGGGRKAHRTRGMYMKESSRTLHEVYGLLMSLFPEAGQQNFDAFYDHLSVLNLL